MGKWIIPVGVLASIVAGVQLLTHSSDESRNQAQAPQKDRPANPATDMENTALIEMDERRRTDPSPDPDKEPPAGEPRNPLTAEDWHDITLWRESRGYITPGNQAIYETYSEATLTELAQNGDIIALQLLAQRAYTNGDERAAAGLFQEAAVQGSTYALAKVGDIITSDIRKQASPTEQREVALYGLAWYQVAVRRGDREVQHNHINRFLRHQGLELTDDEQALVEKHAQALYQDLNRYRQHIGLNSFDNAVPEPVQQLHRLMFPEAAQQKP